MHATDEMYVTLLRGVLEAQVLLPAALENLPAMKRLIRAVQEAGDLYLDAED